MPRRIDAGEVLAAIGGALVFVALFLSWFDGLSGWEAFEALDLVIAALALAAIAVGVSSVTGGALSTRALPWIGAMLVAIIAVQLIEPPPGALHLEVQSVDGDARFFEADPDRETGAWLALAGAGLVLLGGILRLASISVTVSVGGRDVRKRVAAVDRRSSPAPPAASEVPPEPAAGPDPAPSGADPAVPSGPGAAVPSGPDPDATQPFSAVEAQTPTEERPRE